MQNGHAQTVSETSVSKQGSAQLECSTDPHVQAKTRLHGVDVEVDSQPDGHLSPS